MQPLLSGHQYYLSFFVSLAASHAPSLYGKVLSVDRIGAYLSDTMINDSIGYVNAFLQCTPSVKSPPGYYITDTANWTIIDGIYNAHGNERWITLGHFKDGLTDHDTTLYEIRDSAFSNDSFLYCYMYLDDVCLVDINNSTSDTSFCIVLPAAITGGAATGTYLWNTGDTTASIVATMPGTYWRVVKGNCFYHTDTLKVMAAPWSALGNDTLLCIGDTITLGATHPGITYHWSTGDSSLFITAGTAGLYSLTTVSPYCGSAADSINISIESCYNCLFVPGAFTPNNDGKNDVFRPVAGCPVKKYHLSIFNRWGQMLFSTTDINTSWNGTFNNTPQDIGTYFYLVKYTPDVPGVNDEKILSGSIILVR